jgi:hypothetical protein
MRNSICIGLMSTAYIYNYRYDFSELVKLCKPVKLFGVSKGVKSLSRSVPVPRGFSSSYNQRRNGIRGK